MIIMGENNSESCTYYNVPVINSGITQPASSVGVAVIKRENSPAGLRFIIKRDRSVRITSFTLVYRFSTASVRQRDPDHLFIKYVYDKPDINDKKYIILHGKVPEEKVNDGISALVSSITLENGEVLRYKSGDYDDPAESVVSSNGKNADEPLVEYLAAREAALQKKKEAERLSPKPQAEENANYNEDKAESKPRKRKNKLRQKKIQSFTAAFCAILVMAGIIAIKLKQRPMNEINDDRIVELIEDRQYSEAYHLADPSDTDTLQRICELASSHYLAMKNYKSAYIYASAAPEPFDHDVIDRFADYLIIQNRHEELYEFLKDHEEYSDILQKVCESAVNINLTNAEYKKALVYAYRAPVSLESRVIEAAVADLVQDGKLNKVALSLLNRLDDEEEYDSYIRQAAAELVNTGEYISAVTAAGKIKSDEERNATINIICSRGMKAFTDENRLSDAKNLLDKCSSNLDETQISECINGVLDYSMSCGSTAGVIFYRSLTGENTANIVIKAEDPSIRANLSDVYFLLTAQQKRAYHANPFSLYKEAFLVEDGELKEFEIKNVVSVSTFEYQTVILRTNGTVAAVDNNGHNRITSLPTYSDIVQIAAGCDHVVLLHDNGTVTVSGSNARGQADTGEWENIVKTAAGADFTLGLRSDGTIAACGSNLSGQCDVDGYKDVIDIAACDQSAVILFADGSVRVVGDKSMGLYQADSFTEVKRIRAAASCIVAEKEDGSYVMAHGALGADCGSVAGWKNMKYFAAGSVCVGAVDEYGNMQIEGDGKPVPKNDTGI